MKKYIIALIILLVIILGVVLIIQYNRKPEGIIFFYGNKCPHCAKVEAFFKDNDIRNKIKFESKEVSQNKENLRELVRVMKKCGMSTKGYIEVPLLWTGSECLLGTPPIIKFFEEKTGEENPL